MTEKLTASERFAQYANEMTEKKQTFQGRQELGSQAIDDKVKTGDMTYEDNSQKQLDVIESLIAQVAMVEVNKGLSLLEKASRGMLAVGVMATQ